MGTSVVKEAYHGDSIPKFQQWQVAPGIAELLTNSGATLSINVLRAPHISPFLKIASVGLVKPWLQIGTQIDLRCNMAHPWRQFGKETIPIAQSCVGLFCIFEEAQLVGVPPQFQAMAGGSHGPLHEDHFKM